MSIENIALFIKIVEAGSLTAAGREVGLSPTSVSERLAALESHYGVVLLNRTTRAINLTEEGQILLDGAKEVLESVANLESRIKFGAQHLTGTIRVSAPCDLGRGLVCQSITDFLNQHTDTLIDLKLSDSYADIVGEGVDIAIRYGTLSDSSLRTKKIGDTRRLLCASPDYIKSHGAPGTPADLKDHNCLVMRFGQLLDNSWQFGSGIKKQIITVNGNRIADDSELIRNWCIDGFGICRKSELDVKEDLQSGRLVEVLPDYPSPPLPLQLVLPPARSQPRRISAFVDFITDAFKSCLG